MQSEVLRRLRAGLAGLALAAGLLLAPPAMAELSCSVGTAAGKPVPAPPLMGDPGRFRVFWGLSTRLEDIADAAGNSAAMADIREASRLSDGYFINALRGGPVIYWPGRPPECALNLGRFAQGDRIEVEGETLSFDAAPEQVRKNCSAKQKTFLESTVGDADKAADLQADALARAFANLELRDEYRKGKAVWGESLIRKGDFSYDEKQDKVTMELLPRSYCVLNGNGMPPNGLMIYQEVGKQDASGSRLRIPMLNRKGELVYARNSRLDKIPENTHAFRRIAESFVDAGAPVTGLRANLRIWNPRRSPQQAKDLVSIPQFGGFNFEGGTYLLEDTRKGLDNFVEGMSWILANTDRDVSLLMPGYWPRDMVGNEEEIDGLVPRVKDLVVAINRKLGARMKLPKGRNAVCSNRIVFIVGSYGRPMHVESLPMRRANGRLAGTVTGQIKALNDLRAELCGT